MSKKLAHKPSSQLIASVFLLILVLFCSIIIFSLISTKNDYSIYTYNSAENTYTKKVTLSGQKLVINQGVFVKGDFDGDGWQDILNSRGDEYQIIRTDGDNVNSQNLKADLLTYNVAGDFDGDGRDELFTADETQARLLRIGRSAVESNCSLLATPFSVSQFLTAGDFDGNGIDELMLGSVDNSNEIILESSTEEPSDDSFCPVKFRTKPDIAFNLSGDVKYLAAVNINNDNYEDILIHGNDGSKAYLGSLYLTEDELKNAKIAESGNQVPANQETNTDSQSISLLPNNTYLEATDVYLRSGQRYQYLVGNFGQDSNTDIINFQTNTSHFELDNSPTMPQDTKSITRVSIENSAKLYNLNFRDRSKLQTDKIIYYKPSVIIASSDKNGPVAVDALINPSASTGNVMTVTTTATNSGQFSSNLINTSLSSGAVSGQQYIPGDFNGDGVGDVLRYSNGSSDDSLFLGSQARGVKLKANEPLALKASSSKQAIFGYLTATDSEAVGYINVYPCSTPNMTSSVINLAPNTNVSNLVVASSDTNGFICIQSTTPTHILWDQVLASVGEAQNFSLNSQGRIIDTRVSTSSLLKSRIEPNRVYQVKLNVPASQSFGGNLTVTNPESSGFVTVYACKDGQPKTSNINYTAKQTIANYVISKVDIDSNWCIISSARTDLIFDHSFSSALVSPLPNNRLLDSRVSSSTITGKLKANTPIKIQLPLVSNLPVGNSLFGNLTAVDADALGYATVYDCDSQQPAISTLNFYPGRATAGAFVSRISNGSTICLISNVNTHIIVDIFAQSKDLLIKSPPARLVDSRLTISTNAHTYGQAQAISKLDTKSIVLRGDFDGNNTEDVIYYTPDTTKADPMYSWNQRTSKFEKCVSTIFNPSIVSSQYRPTAGDFNGDGADDIFWYTPGSNTKDFIWFGTVNKSPAGFCSYAPIGFEMTGTGGDFTITSGDLNGDNADELILYDKNTSIFIWPSKKGAQSGTMPFVGFKQHPAIVGSFTPVVSDINQDGLGDIVWYNPTTNNQWLWTGSTSSELIGSKIFVNIPSGGSIISSKYSTVNLGGTTKSVNSLLFINEPYANYESYHIDPKNQLVRDANIEKFIQALALQESSGNPLAFNKLSSASGKYQYIPSTWKWKASLYYTPALTYLEAYKAPEAVQDAVVFLEYTDLSKKYGGSIFNMALNHFYPIALRDPTLLDIVPKNNVVTPRQYAQGVVDKVNNGYGSNIKLYFNDAPDFKKYYSQLTGL